MGRRLFGMGRHLFGIGRRLFGMGRRLFGMGRRLFGQIIFDDLLQLGHAVWDEAADGSWRGQVTQMPNVASPAYCILLVESLVLVIVRRSLMTDLSLELPCYL